MASKSAQRRKNLKGVELFDFTPHEISLLYHRLKTAVKQAMEGGRLVLVSVSRKAPLYLARSREKEFNLHVTRVIGAIVGGNEKSHLPQKVYEEIHSFALTAYVNSRRMGHSKNEARRAAVLFAQLPMERYLFNIKVVSNS